MHIDDELCVCFHVSWRKVINFIRVHRVRLPSQLSQCQGAGTGCGWCRRAMTRLVDQIGDNPPDVDELEHWLANRYGTQSQYVDGRREYITAQKQSPGDD